jgi:HSP20 family protein
MAEEQQSGTVTRWNPFAELESRDPWGGLTDWRRRLDEIFGERTRMGQLVPAVDVTESEEEYLVSADVPGVKKDDLTVEIEGGSLRIRGERKSEREETKDKARHLERSYGAFSRAFTLPADADSEKVEASFEDGVLKVRIAKRPEAKAQQVAIKS